MKKLVFGSLNIDRVYALEQFVQPGQTVTAHGYECICGGKGFNLATAMAHAGEEVWFAGAIGPDGDIFLKAMTETGIHTELLKHSDFPCGHAVIQVNQKGENCIIVERGANGDIPLEYIYDVLNHFKQGDLLVVQNEISNLPAIVQLAHEKKMVVAWNPSPIDPSLDPSLFACADILFLNEVEAQTMTGVQNMEQALQILHHRFAGQMIVLTLGGEGAVCQVADGTRYSVPAFEVPVKDTTAAGDTFTGYFLSGYFRHREVPRALRTAAAAAAISVSRKGASVSIPQWEEVERLEKQTEGGNGFYEVSQS